MKKGVRRPWYSQDNNKAERRKPEKVLNSDLRLFSGSPSLFLVIVKMYCGSFISDYLKNRIKNGSALGVNVYSKEWDMLVHGMRRVDPNLEGLFAGDYSGYDGSLIIGM